MDPREQIGDREESLRAMLDGRQSAIWTMLPGIIESFDPATQSVSVKSALTFTKTAQDGAQSQISMPVLVDCPVLFPSGGGYILTFPIQQGDECTLNFSCRCIDSWWQSGGVQKQQTIRLHDLSDGFVTVGPKSKPNVPASIATDAVELRSLDNTIHVRIDADALTLKHPIKVVADTPLFQVTGAIEAAGEITSTLGGTHTLTQHIHTQSNDSHGDTEMPTDKPTG